MLFKFGKIESPLCSPCNLKAETPLWHYGTNCVKIYSTLLVFHHLLHRVLFLRNQPLLIPGLVPNQILNI